ncbi:KamA family radical SAM protein [Bacteroidota bacterium]
MNQIFFDEDMKNWNDWKWQFRNRITINNFYDHFPNLPDNDKVLCETYCTDYNFAITPYTLSLIELDENGNPLKNDPIWRQFQFRQSVIDSNSAGYDGSTENWENPNEMHTPILHQKYPGRAIIRLVNQCFGYCNYCYLTKRILDRSSNSPMMGNNKVWQNTIDFLKNSGDIKEVLISGGDPLILDNEKLERILFDLSKIDSLQNIRLNTRAFTFNPFRIDRDFVKLVKKYKITAIEIHLCHSREFTDDFDHSLNLFDETGYRPLFLWRTPLLKGVNDNIEELENLFLSLYARRIIPYYLFHYTPFALGRSSLGVSIKRGIKMLQQLRRKIPGPAFPRFTLFHITGKQDIPLETEGNSEFIFDTDDSGNNIVKFLNWRNEWVTYPDTNND